MSGLAIIVCLILIGIAVWAIIKGGGRSAYRPIDRLAPTSLPNPGPATGPSFCASCGAALAPGIAFCGSCGARVEAMAPPAAPALPPAPAPNAAPTPPQTAMPAQPAAAPAAPGAPAPGPAAQPSGNPQSLDLQPGETSLGSWTVNIDRGRLLTGKLTVTDQRLMFRPQTGGVGLITILQSQQKGYKDAHTIILGRDQIVAVQVEKSLLKKNLHVTAANGILYVFGCGPNSVDQIAQILQQR